MRGKKWLALGSAIIALGVVAYNELPEVRNLIPLPPQASFSDASSRLSTAPYDGPLPVTSSEELIHLKNRGYLVGYSTNKRNPAWVSYFLDWNQPKYEGLTRPTEGFDPDPRVPDPVVTSDYTRQGYDRGHMAPSFAIGKFHGREAQLETFLMTNIAPQIHAMNDGVWNSVERMEADDFVKRFGKVLVICGPIYEQNPQRFPAGVAVPVGFFKVILRPDNQTIAFAIPQHPQHSRPEMYLRSIADIEKMTGLNILPQLSPEEKTRTRTKIW